MQAFPPLAFVDLEATGGDPSRDRITEIGVVLVTDGQVETWHTLVNPEQPITPFVAEMTGIHDDMVATAPCFDAIAATLATKLDGRLFIAHNAHFDYTVLHHAYQRVGQWLSCDVLCTLKLAKQFAPDSPKQNLDALIARYDLPCTARHRALGDAEVLHHFWQALLTHHGEAALLAAVNALVSPAAKPPAQACVVPPSRCGYLPQKKPNKKPRAAQKAERGGDDPPSL